MAKLKNADYDEDDPKGKSFKPTADDNDADDKALGKPAAAQKGDGGTLRDELAKQLTLSDAKSAKKQKKRQAFKAKISPPESVAPESK